jgi:hypothetical protein
MMTNKNYIKAAKIVQSYDNPTERKHKKVLITAFCCLFCDDNPAFDIKQFIAACDKKS